MTLDIDNWNWSTYSPHPNSAETSLRNTMKMFQIALGNVKVLSEAYALIEQYHAKIDEILNKNQQFGTFDAEVSFSIKWCMKYIFDASSSTIVAQNSDTLVEYVIELLHIW